jgi:hypothetical protein
VSAVLQIVSAMLLKELRGNRGSRMSGENVEARVVLNVTATSSRTTWLRLRRWLSADGLEARQFKEHESRLPMTFALLASKDVRVAAVVGG